MPQVPIRTASSIDNAYFDPLASPWVLNERLYPVGVVPPPRRTIRRKARAIYNNSERQRPPQQHIPERICWNRYCGSRLESCVHSKRYVPRSVSNLGVFTN